MLTCLPHRIIRRWIKLFQNYLILTSPAGLPPLDTQVSWSGSPSLSSTVPLWPPWWVRITGDPGADNTVTLATKIFQFSIVKNISIIVKYTIWYLSWTGADGSHWSLGADLALEHSAVLWSQVWYLQVPLAQVLVTDQLVPGITRETSVDAQTEPILGPLQYSSLVIHNTRKNNLSMVY